MRGRGKREGRGRKRREEEKEKGEGGGGRRKGRRKEKEEGKEERKKFWKEPRELSETCPGFEPSHIINVKPKVSACVQTTWGGGWGVELKKGLAP